MKKQGVLIATLSLIWAVSGTANAVSVYSDVYDPADMTLNAGDSHIWLFDITDDGFDVDLQDILSATITLSVADDGLQDRQNAEEAAFAMADMDNLAFTVANGVTTAYGVSFDLTSFTELDTAGTLEACLTGTNGDFKFFSATLEVTATDPVSAVPVPAAVWLFGTGLIG
ncbi:MAG: hypothetical protein OEY35_04280, partial [Gammaproteobacteria bacterium]|nr:hypothetical protein [Gammaproteobacteria bacterium]